MCWRDSRQEGWESHGPSLSEITRLLPLPFYKLNYLRSSPTPLYLHSPPGSPSAALSDGQNFFCGCAAMVRSMKDGGVVLEAQMTGFPQVLVQNLSFLLAKVPPPQPPSPSPPPLCPGEGCAGPPRCLAGFSPPSQPALLALHSFKHKIVCCSS